MGNIRDYWWYRRDDCTKWKTWTKIREEDWEGKKGTTWKKIVRQDSWMASCEKP